MLKVTEQTEFCTQARLQRLKSIGIQSDGQIDSLIKIMAKKGLKLPTETKEGFRFDLVDEKGKNYVFIYLTMCDAIAEKLLKIFEKISKSV